MDFCQRAASEWGAFLCLGYAFEFFGVVDLEPMLTTVSLSDAV